MSLKIGFIAGTLGRGGAEQQLHYMLRAQRECGHEACVLSLTRGEWWESRIEELRIPIRHVGARSSPVMRLMAIAREIRRCGAQIAQSQHFYTNAYAAVAARLNGIRGIGAIRSDARSEFRANKGVLGQLHVRLPRLLAVNSKAALANLRAVGIPDERLHYLPNVVDVDRFAPRQGTGPGPVRIVGVGRFVPAKRFDRFIRIIAQLAASLPGQIAGELAGSGPEEADLRKLAERHDLAPEVLRFRGQVSDAASVYRDADILLHTADWEGTPNVLLEAMASGIPVVATRVGGIPDLVEDGTSGLLAPAGDLDGLLQRVRSLVDNPALRQQMGRRGREWVVENHSLMRLQGELESLYRRALGRADAASLVSAGRPASVSP